MIPPALAEQNKENWWSNVQRARILTRTFWTIGSMRHPISSKFRAAVVVIRRLTIHRWLYTLFLMMDANFRARCKDRGFDDIELAPGWAYYVEEQAYLAHVTMRANEKDLVSVYYSMSQSQPLMLTKYLGKHLLHRAQRHTPSQSPSRRVYRVRRWRDLVHAPCSGPEEWRR